MLACNAPSTSTALRTQGEAEVLEELDAGCKSQARALLILGANCSLKQCWCPPPQVVGNLLRPLRGPQL
eukprot:12918767-Prorocentrum_lima.AAC.1